MSKESIFDDMTRVLGSNISRREANKQLFILLAGAAAGALGIPRFAKAGPAIVCASAPFTCAGESTPRPIDPLCANQQWYPTPATCGGVAGGLATCQKVCDDGIRAYCQCLCYTGQQICYENPLAIGGVPVCCTETQACTPCSVDGNKCCLPGQRCVGSQNSSPRARCCNPSTPITGSFSAGTISISSGCGIQSISVSCDNCTYTISPYSCSTTSASVVGTKTDPSKRAHISATVTDCTGASQTVDPVFTTLQITTGRWVRQTFADIPKAESYISVTNGDPGLKKLDIRVNSQRHKMLRLKANETKSINVAYAMKAGAHNTISLTGRGKLGGSADVAIMNTPPSELTHNVTKAPGVAMASAHSLSHHNTVWGNLVEEVEEASDLHGADASTQTVRITFKGALDRNAASNPGLYTITVNGNPAFVQAANAQQRADGADLVLQLPPGTLRSGNKVDVYWDDLLDTQGRPLSGHVSLIAQRLH